MGIKPDKHWLVALGCGLPLYALLWWLTHVIGVPQVRQQKVEAMPVSPAFTDLTTNAAGGRVSGPVYSCRAVAPAPFVVRVEYGWHKGPLNGESGSVLYLWFFGVRFPFWEYSHWSE